MSVGVLDDLHRGIGEVAPISVDQYHRMIVAGILEEDAPLELIDGMLVRRNRQDQKESNMPQGERHSSVIGQLNELLTLRCVPLGCHLRIQLPLPLPPIDEPEPDACIVRGRAREYLGRFPERADVLVVIEVSDSSLSYDQNTKMRLYAASSLPTYLIVNLQSNVIELYQHPDPIKQSFDRQTFHQRGDIVELSLGVLGSVSLAVDELIQGDV